MDISVIISNYNNANYIQECLNSVLKQSKITFECIVVDDCSTDKSVLDILNQYELQYPNFKLIKHSCNKGCGEARRTGLKYATGKYTIFCDSDDYYLHNDYLYNLFIKAESTGSDLVRSGYTDLNGEHNEQYESIIEDRQQRISIFQAHPVTSLWTVLTKRTLWNNIEYCPRPCIEDTPTYVKLLLAANKIAYINDCGYYYRTNPNSIIQSIYPLKFQLFNTLSHCDIVDECEKYSVTPRWTKMQIFNTFFVNARIGGWAEESFIEFKKYLLELDKYYEKFINKN